jgi:lipoyl synthase
MTRPEAPAADANTVREAQPAASYDATAKQKGQDRPHPDQDRAG